MLSSVRLSYIFTLLIALSIGPLATPVRAITFPYVQTFDTNTANISGDPAYPEFTLTSGTGNVTGGILNLGGDQRN
jgi:hypothetical protein